MRSWQWLTGRSLAFDLGWWADLRAAGEFVVTVAKASDEGFEAGGREYPRDQAPALKGLEWGEAHERTFCRLRLKQRVRQERETPVVLADVRYRGSDRDLSLRRSPMDSELELNGVWHSWQGKPNEWRRPARMSRSEAQHARMGGDACIERLRPFVHTVRNKRADPATLPADGQRSPKSRRTNDGK